MRTLLIAALIATCLMQMPQGASAQNTGFVAAAGTTLVLQDSLYYFVGTNNYYLMVYAADAGLRGYVDEVLADAAAMGVKVIRTWAFNDGASQWNALQTEPGVYSETVFQGLDYVLKKADELGIRLILPLVNNWDDYGGMNQYVAWDATYGGTPTASTHDDFYTDSDIRTWYKDHVAAVLNRVNTYNGRAYKDDPTVFAWELANEPRAQSDTSGDKLNDWIVEMSSYIKGIDSNHLLTTGEEGFYDEGSGPWYRNGSQGTDFLRNHQVSDIDFCTVHIYTDYWGFSYSASMDWVEEHIEDAHNVIGKPVILEEFGKYRDTSPPVPNPPVPTGGTGNTSTRDSYFTGFYDKIYSMDAAGSNFWILYHDAYPDYDGFGVYYPDDTATVSIIMSEADRMRLKSNPLPALSLLGALLLSVAVCAISVRFIGG
jgi:mannan endo-1,4-beta-mannosidase